MSGKSIGSIEVLECAAKWPELRFGQFITNILTTEDDRIENLFYINDSDLGQRAKDYCKKYGR